MAASIGVRVQNGKSLAPGSVGGKNLAAGALKFRAVAGRNGAKSLTVTSALATDTIESVLNLTDGGDVTSSFSATVGTGGLTQSAATDFSAKILLVVLKPGV